MAERRVQGARWTHSLAPGLSWPAVVSAFLEISKLKINKCMRYCSFEKHIKLLLDVLRTRHLVGYF